MSADYPMAVFGLIMAIAIGGQVWFKHRERSLRRALLSARAEAPPCDPCSDIAATGAASDERAAAAWLLVARELHVPAGLLRADDPLAWLACRAHALQLWTDVDGLSEEAACRGVVDNDGAVISTVGELVLCLARAKG